MHTVWVVTRKVNPLLTNDSDYERHSEQKSEHKNALADDQLKLLPIKLIYKCLADNRDEKDEHDGAGDSSAEEKTASWNVVVDAGCCHPTVVVDLQDKHYYHKCDNTESDQT